MADQSVAITERELLLRMIRHAPDAAAESFKTFVLKEAADLMAEAEALVDLGLFRADIDPIMEREEIERWSELLSKCLPPLLECSRENDRTISVLTKACADYTQSLAGRHEESTATLRVNFLKWIETAIDTDKPRAFMTLLNMAPSETTRPGYWTTRAAFGRLMNHGAGGCIEALVNAGVLDLGVATSGDLATGVTVCFRANHTPGIEALARIGALEKLGVKAFEDLAVEAAKTKIGTEKAIPCVIESDAVSLSGALRMIMELVRRPLTSEHMQDNVLNIIRRCAKHHGQDFIDMVNSKGWRPHLAYHATEARNLFLALELEKLGADITTDGPKSPNVLLRIVGSHSEQVIHDFVESHDISDFIVPGTSIPSKEARAKGRDERVVGYLLAAESAIAIRRAHAGARP